MGLQHGTAGTGPEFGHKVDLLIGAASVREKYSAGHKWFYCMGTEKYCWKPTYIFVIWKIPRRSKVIFLWELKNIVQNRPTFSSTLFFTYFPVKCLRDFPDIFLKRGILGRVCLERTNSWTEFWLKKSFLKNIGLFSFNTLPTINYLEQISTTLWNEL